MPTATTNSDTCARLLAAAVEVFGEVGYREATLRAICQRAGANSAAVNYHFRDKQHLYLAVIEHAIEAAQVHPPRAEAEQCTGAEDRLRDSIQGMLAHLLGQGPTSCLMKLVAWELAEPTAGLDLVIKKAIAPFDAELGAIVRELAGPSITPEQVEDCVSSIVAQCHYYHQARAVVFRVRRYSSYSPATIEHLADHITQFSLAGIRAMAQG